MVVSQVKFKPSDNMYLPKSENELKVIKSLMEFPDRNWSLRDISEESGVPKTTVWRAVNRLEERNFISTSEVGKSTVVEVKNRDVMKKILKLSRTEISELEEVAKKFVEEVKTIDEVKKCVLFGSVARRTADLNSDVDILILVEDKGGKLDDEISQIADRFGSEESVRIMPDIMEEERFESMKRQNDIFAENVGKEGITLYEVEDDG